MQDIGIEIMIIAEGAKTVGGSDAVIRNLQHDQLCSWTETKGHAVRFKNVVLQKFARSKYA